MLKPSRVNKKKKNKENWENLSGGAIIIFSTCILGAIKTIFNNKRNGKNVIIYDNKRLRLFRSEREMLDNKRKAPKKNLICSFIGL